MRREVIQTALRFRDWMVECGSTFSLDTETTSLNYLDLEIIGFSICDGKQACYVDLLAKDINKQWALDLLGFYVGESKMVVMHNAPYDMLVLRKYGIEL